MTYQPPLVPARCVVCRAAFLRPAHTHAPQTCWAHRAHKWRKLAGSVVDTEPERVYSSGTSDTTK